MKRIKEIVLKDNGNVTFKMEEVDYYWGTIRRRWQFTVRRRELERALREAKVEVPWDQVNRGQ